MRKVAVLVVLALVVPALADFVPAQAQQGASFVGTLPDGRGAAVYDNTVNFTQYAYGNAPLGSEVGDEVFPDFSGAPGQILDDLVISAGTFDEPGLLYGDVSVNIYNYNYDTGLFDLAGNVSEAGLTFNLAPGYFDAISWTGLSGLNISLTDDVLVTVTWSNANVANVGQLIMSDAVVGFSGDYFYKNGQWLWFGGDPVANLYYYLGAIPEPSSLALLALGALAFVRRR